MNTKNNSDIYLLNSDYYYNEDNGYIFSLEDPFVRITFNDKYTILRYVGDNIKHKNKKIILSKKEVETYFHIVKANDFLKLDKKKDI